MLSLDVKISLLNLPFMKRWIVFRKGYLNFFTLLFKLKKFWISLIYFLDKQPLFTKFSIPKLRDWDSRNLCFSLTCNIYMLSFETKSSFYTHLLAGSGMWMTLLLLILLIGILLVYFLWPKKLIFICIEFTNERIFLFISRFVDF